MVLWSLVDRRELVDRAQARLHGFEVLLLRHQVALVQDQSIGEGHLLHTFIFGALRLLLVQVLHDVLRIDQGNNPIELAERRDLVIHKKRLRDRRRVGHARRLDDDRIESQLAGLHTLRELLEHGDQVLPDGAADAPVHHLEELLILLNLGVTCEQRVVDAHVAELVLDDGDLLPVRFVRQDVIHQRRLPAAEVAGEDGDGDAGVRFGHGRVEYGGERGARTSVGVFFARTTTRGVRLGCDGAFAGFPDAVACV